MIKRSARERLIVALDSPSSAQALNLVDALGDLVLFYKVGWLLFVTAGMELVRMLRDRGKDVFLDLKMDDIEETIETAVRAISDDVMFLTIHGSAATARAAGRGRGASQYPKLLSVTLLSSLNEEDLRDILSVSETSRGPLLNDYVLHRARRALASGCDGLIASGETIKLLRDELGPEPIIVSPGIRPKGSPHDDHKRAATPRGAMLYGADFLVVGRPIRLAPEPVAASEAILKEMDDALAEVEASRK